MRYIFRYMLKTESDLIRSARLKGKIIPRPTIVALAVFGFLYIWSPVDLIPELAAAYHWVTYIDDIILGVYTFVQIAMEVMAMLQGPKARKGGLSDAVEEGDVLHADDTD